MRILLLVVTVLVAAAPVGSAATTTSTRLPDLEQALVAEINATRAAHGLRPLRVAPGLVISAGRHSRAMLARGFFDHRSADGTSMADRVQRSYVAQGYVGWTVGENLLMASPSIDARAAVNLWLGSPGHRRNLLSPSFRQLGVGAITRDGAPGVFGGATTVVITLDLGARRRAS